MQPLFVIGLLVALTMTTISVNGDIKIYTCNLTEKPIFADLPKFYGIKYNMHLSNDENFLPLHCPNFVFGSEMVNGQYNFNYDVAFKTDDGKPGHQKGTFVNATGLNGGEVFNSTSGVPYQFYILNILKDYFVDIYGCSKDIPTIMIGSPNKDFNKSDEEKVFKVLDKFGVNVPDLKLKKFKCP